MLVNHWNMEKTMYWCMEEITKFNLLWGFKAFAIYLFIQEDNFRSWQQVGSTGKNTCQNAMILYPSFDQTLLFCECCRVFWRSCSTISNLWCISQSQGYATTLTAKRKWTLLVHSMLNSSIFSFIVKAKLRTTDVFFISEVPFVNSLRAIIFL